LKTTPENNLKKCRFFVLHSDPALASRLWVLFDLVVVFAPMHMRERVFFVLLFRMTSWVGFWVVFAI
jgi:hypothetical protein